MQDTMLKRRRNAALELVEFCYISDRSVRFARESKGKWNDTGLC